MINLGDEVIVKGKSDKDYIKAKLVDIDLSTMLDTVELENGEFMKVDRTAIYPANINEIYSYKTMKGELNEGICEVTFTKKNGEERVMPCTLNFEHIPEENHPKGNGAQHNSQDTIAVWCMDKEAWRSFRIDSVTKFERLTGVDRGEKTTINLEGIL